MKQNNTLRNTLILTGIVFVIFLIIVILLVRTNTGFLTFNPPKDQIDDNNNNSGSGNTDSFSTLVGSKITINGEEQTLKLPRNFEIGVFASDLGAARAFDFDDKDNIYITDRTGRVILLKDTNQDGVSDNSIVVDSGLRSPHGVDFYDGDLYVGEEDKVVVYQDITTDGKYSNKKVLISGLPTDVHVTRTVVIGPDQKLYLSIGSSCNVCEETDKRRGAISRYSLDGKFEKIYAEGLRNTVGFIFERNASGQYDMWGVDNGRDLIGDEIPPEEVNIIQEDKHYGWPYCYGDQVANPEYLNKADFCKTETELPKYNMQSHSAPLGLAFMRAVAVYDEFPAALSRDLFVTFHGSWNRTVPTGYKVVRIDTAEENPNTVNFITGWLQDDGTAWGRPVHVAFDSKNVMFISDDKAGVLYRVSTKN